MIYSFFTSVKSFIKKIHLLWIIFYFLLIGGTVSFGSNLYEKYNEDQLPDGNIELLINKTKYQLGETVEFTVINHFPTTIYVTNQCPKEPLNVYRWQNQKWIQIHDEATSEDSECYSQERNVGILPENSRSYNFKDWPNLFKEPGVYRIAMTVNHYGDLPFQDFVILEAPKIIEILPEASRVKLPVIIQPLPPQQIEEEDEHEYEQYDDD